MGKHTPGPWKLINDKFGDYSIQVPAGRGTVYVIADNIGGQVYVDSEGKFTDYSTVEANASLIAAAPGLLALLVRYRNEVPLGHQPHMAASEADALIAKATGESHG